jgi:hypothetical protein
MPEAGSTFRNLTEEERSVVVQRLYAVFDGTSLPHGALQRVADQFFVNRSTIQRIWMVTRAADKNHDPYVF